jgi:hypothetical protein
MRRGLIRPGAILALARLDDRDRAGVLLAVSPYESLRA